jgi:hypothetical protein
MHDLATVPDDLSDLTVEDLKKLFQEASAMAAVHMLHEYIDVVRVSQDPEVKRKALVFFRENSALGAVAPKEDKPDYPVFHFNIGGGANMTVTASTPQGTQTLEFTPSEVMAASAYINADVAFDD